MTQHETPTGGPPPAYLLRLLSEGNSAKVIELLATKNRLPEDCTSLNILGVAHLAQKQPLQAYTVLQKSFVQNPADLNVLNNMAISLKQLGRVREAIDFYKRAASLKKDDADIAFNLALALKELGDNEAAKNYYRNAIMLNPNMALAYNNYGNILKEEGEVDSALSLYREAAEADPRLTQPAINIANIHLQLGKNAEAIRVLIKAVEHSPKSSPLQARLGAAYSASNQFHDAIRHLKLALVLDHTSAFALNSLGLAYKNIGSFEESEKALKAALQREPNNFEFLINIANLALETGKDDEADRYLKQASVLASPSAAVFNNLGAIALKRFKIIESQNLILSALDCDSSFAPAHFNLGKTYERMGLGAKAKEAYQAALSLEPDNITFSYALASLNYYSGDYEEATSELGRTLDTKNTHIESLRLLIDIEGGNLPARYVEKLKALLESGNVSLREKSKINFCLYEVYKSNGEIEKAFSYLRSGNHTRKNILSYDIEEDKDLFASLNTYSHSWHDHQFSQKSVSSQIPIFIIGMPRSGTTLLEREVSRNFEVTPLGELPFAQELIQQMQAEKLTIREQILKLRAGYLEKITDYRIFSGFFTDKMPQNFRYAVLLSKAFPEAKFLHIFRSPEAVCWSIYERSFEGDGLRFAYDLGDIRDYYNLYVGMMTEYSRFIGDRVFHIDYEKFTEHSGACMAEVSEFLGLPIVSNSEAGDASAELFFTASATQVRKPVFRGSSLKWLDFKDWILDDLEGLRRFELPK